MNNNFELSLAIFIPNITSNHAITNTNSSILRMRFRIIVAWNN